jgi:penicillin-binding protein 1C
VTYESSREGEEIALEAAADASVTDLFWFVDDGFVGKSKPGESLFWRAHPGEFKIRVVDSGGASDQMTVKINAR